MPHRNPSLSVLKKSLKIYFFPFSQLSLPLQEPREFPLVLGKCFLFSRRGANAQKSIRTEHKNQNLYILNTYNEDQQLEKFRSHHTYNLHESITRLLEDENKIPFLPS